MTDRKVLHDPTETPEDVATLYSWANLHGAKYRDFSASRAQTREKARLRVQEAIEEERRRVRERLRRREFPKPSVPLRPRGSRKKSARLNCLRNSVPSWPRKWQPSRPRN